LDQSLLSALKNEIQAKAEIKGNLDTYKYYDNVRPGTWGPAGAAVCFCAVLVQLHANGCWLSQ